MTFEKINKLNTKLFFIAIIVFNLVSIVQATDWPMWRYDAGRTANSPEELAEDLFLLWTQEYSPREPVWDDPLNQDLMQYDRIFEPIVLGDYMFIGFNDRDKVIAIDINTGKQKWTYYTEGPVRLPLVGWNNKIYFTSDDGYLYCLSAKKGELLWKFRGGPSNRKLLGNKRLISMWPARGGAVVKNGIVYFAASIWPWMGTFIYALDAETGKLIWRNEDTNADYILQPHNYTAFAGVAPQGAFVATEDRLLIPGGRSVPACFDRKTGELLYYHLAAGGKTGGAFVCANEKVFFNHHRDRVVHLYGLENGKQIYRALGEYPVLTDEYYYFSDEAIRATSVNKPDSIIWEFEIDASGDLIKTGSVLYAAGMNHITALKLSKNGGIPKVTWRKNIDGNVERLLAANGKLFAVTFDGRIMAFSNSRQKEKNYYTKKKQSQQSKKTVEQAKNIIDQTSITDGYAVFFGAGNGNLLTELVNKTNLNIVVVEENAKKIDKLRHRFDELGIYGLRVSLIQGTPNSVQLPAYFASLTILWDVNVLEFLSDSSIVKKIYSSVRPYGGKLWAPLAENQFSKIAKANMITGLSNAVITHFDNNLIISKKGGLEGSDNWTHQYGDITNTVKSDDDLVKMPLGILWFGGNSNLDVLPRHGHGPPEQVVDGRLIIEGMKTISARDVYTGRVLWKTGLDSLETFQMYYNETYVNTPLVASYNQRHIPGANGRGTNFIATHDFVYIIQGGQCEVLDMTNGEIKKVFSLPLLNTGEQADWGYIGVYDSYLIAGSQFAQFSTLVSPTEKEREEITKLSLRRRTDKRDKENHDLSASQSLVVMDRYSGFVKWQLNARFGFIHNSIIATNDKIYCLDKLPAFIENKLKRRGITPPENYRLLVIDIKTGEILQEVENDIFGSWLSYSKEYDLLLQASRPSGDMLRGESGNRMIVYRAKDMTKIWDKQIRYHNPAILHRKRIITEHLAYDLLTGKQINRRDPLTDEIIPWTYTRTKGCNYSVASEHLLSFRSSAAAFFNLDNNGGTGHFGGFKSGCTSNLIAANGVLNAPDYTRTCQCAFQNQTSLAMVHMPDVEYWTTSDFKWKGNRIKKIGINLNAPGDRMADNGTLWLDYPSIGGPSPDVPIKMETLNADYFRRHSGFLEGDNVLPWVSASAIGGIRNIVITVSSSENPISTNYTVHLYFAELDNKKAGERVFDINIHDQHVLENFDIVKEANGINREVKKSFFGVSVNDTLNIKFEPSMLAPLSEPLLSGVEILLEE
ncbi:PQQ-binding-like beta-propeller repeat protein [candidate division KSB1 bacterium]|nr:PQQ-binding-like beta-propeller repeat protein [candidate division KSB1 bacterium]